MISKKKPVNVNGEKYVSLKPDVVVSMELNGIMILLITGLYLKRIAIKL